jgi:hypothetical protein
VYRIHFYWKYLIIKLLTTIPCIGTHRVVLIYHDSPDRPNHNFAAGVIREVRKKWLRIMIKKKVPPRLWDYGFHRVCDILQNQTSNSARATAHSRRSLVSLLTLLNISTLGFTIGYGIKKTPDCVGPLISYWVLTHDGRVLSRTTVQCATILELST